MKNDFEAEFVENALRAQEAADAAFKAMSKIETVDIRIYDILLERALDDVRLWGTSTDSRRCGI